MGFAVGDRVKGYTATGAQVEGVVVKCGATALLLDCGKVISAGGAELICLVGERVQLTIFDALANPEPEAPAPPQPLESRVQNSIAYQEARIRAYQDFIDTLLATSQRRWEEAQGDAEALAHYREWAAGVNRWSVQKLQRLQAEARAKIEQLEKGR